jgi:hypothetical protein
MAIYYQHLCDRTGRALKSKKIEAACLQDVMVHANMYLGSMIGQLSTKRFDPQGRIEIVDPEGRPLARIYCAEAIAARM